ncbi:hypothetical protein GCM10009844_17470 [Nocardioides koreensis]|uniref:Zn-dependent metalloprotease n=1 Tax=Nocardioides koreensis TaxID=433651 RepID=A0ABN2ZLW5_9ACTN
MKFFRQGISLALLGAGLAAVPGLQAAAAGSAPQAAAGSLVQQMRQQADGSVALSKERATGRVGFVRAARHGDLLPSVAADDAASAAHKATAYLDKYAPAFGTTDAQLEQSALHSDRFGWTISYTQTYRGVPVFGSMLKANVDKAGDLTSVNGYAAPALDLGVTPRLSASEAASRAVSTVRAVPPGGASTDTRGIEAGSNHLTIYRMGAIKGDPGEAVLAYVVEVTNGHNIRDMVFVDANTGKVVNRYSMVDNALDRELDEAVVDDNGTPTDPSDDFVRFDKVWEEGDPFPSDLNEDQQNLVNSSGESYWFFQNAFGRDSYDGEGAKRITVNNDPRISCPNANWNGVTTNYCDGVTSDDVVAHEWGHAYTEYTSGLIYQWQPGAMNEGYSDIWGETLDLINNREDEEEGNIDAPRPVGLCSTHSPAKPLLTINSPGDIARDCATGGASFGKQLDAAGITGDVVLATDAAETGGTTTDGCSPFDNAAEVAGKIALVDRGLCAFTEKAQNAKDAGAAALIIGNRDDSVISMSGDDPTLPTTVSIGLTDREAIKTALAKGETVNVTMKDAGGERYDSYRWLVGEKSPAFGGAIRDMWNPTCYGDPGKVSDAEYHCSTDDNGGVHGNSGVVNHSYSLLVDGGTYNNVAVTGIGLDKAANLYWYTQTHSLTPTSDFADLADGLQNACTQLTGKPINELSTEKDTSVPATQLITPADCQSVDAMIAAVELRQNPAQCNFQPLLQKGAPASCGKGFKSRTFWKDDFEHGLGAWTRSEEVVYDGAHGFPWRATSEVPGKHDSKVAFGPDPDPQGASCAADANDISSRDSIASPRVTLPGGNYRRLSFQHYVATESGYDGGNVKIKVNGGKWQVIPAEAYVFNAPDTLATAEEGNTNPLAGEPGFTGTDGGEVFGSWGKSIVDLKKAGAGKGDRIKIRFDMGRDGCGGIDGWYVDNVKLVVCKKKHGGHRAEAGDRRSTVSR